jgi:hypothetical protein
MLRTELSLKVFKDLRDSSYLYVDRTVMTRIGRKCKKV